MSSANNRSLESVFMPRGRSLIYIINSNGPEIDPCGTPHFIVPKSNENFADDSETLCQHFASYLQDCTKTTGH